MADIFTRAKRSEVMARIRSRGNKSTELALAELFREQGITGWRRHYPIAGRPDFAFPRRKLAVFVDGCFWHACPEHGAKPGTNVDYWSNKLAANVARDKAANKALRSKGWQVVRIWQHDLRPASRKVLLRRLHRLFGHKQKIGT